MGLNTTQAIDKLSHTKHRLVFFTELLTQATSNEDGGLNLALPSIQTGLYFTLLGITEDIEAVLHVLTDRPEQITNNESLTQSPKQSRPIELTSRV